MESMTAQSDKALRELKTQRLYLDLFIEAPGAELGESRPVEFLIGHRPGHPGNDDCDCRRFIMECVASRERPPLVHGVLGG